MAALHDMLTITIVDDDTPIATAEIEPDLDESGDVWGPHQPLVEFRVLRYSLLPAFERIRPVLRAAGAAMDTLSRRDDDLTASARAATIDRYLAAHSWMDDDQRNYALAARRGDVL